MTVAIANVVVTTDTFQGWVDRTNQVCDAMSTRVMSAEANSTGASTSGNSNLIGIFSANTVAVKTQLRGGTVDVPAALAIVSNTVFSGSALTSSANVSLAAANVFINSTSTSVVGGSLVVASNTTLTGSTVVVNALTSANVTSPTLNVTSNTYFTGANNVISGANTVLSGGAVNISSTLNATAAATFSANVTLNGAVQSINGNTNFDSGTLFVDGVNNRIGIGNTLPDATLKVTGTANVSGNVVFSGTSHTLSGNVAFNTSTLFVDATNGRIGVGTTSPGQLFVVNGVANVVGAAAFANTLSVVGSTALSNTLVVSGATTLNGSILANNAVTVNGAVTISGSTTLNNTGTFNGNTVFSANVAIAGNRLVVDTVNANVIIGNTSSNVAFNTYGNTTHTGSMTVSGTVGVSGVATFSSNTNISSGVLFVNTVTGQVGVGTVSPDASLKVAGTANVSGNVVIGGNLSMATSTLTVNSVSAGFLTVTSNGAFANIQSNGMASFTNVNISGTQTTATSNVSVANANTYINATIATIAGTTLNVTANTTLSGTTAVSGNMIFQSISEQLVATQTLDTNIGTAQTVMQFPASTYRSSRILAQVVNGVNFQTSDMILTHNGNTSSTPFLTVYGTVCAPTYSNTLASFSVIFSGSNVAIQATQTASSSTVKLVADFIK